MDITQMILAILFFGLLVGIYIFLFLLNRKTPKPEGCEDLRPDCSACKDWSCPNHKPKEESEVNS